MIAREIPLGEILVDYAKNPRGHIDEKDVDDLLRSIKSVHVLSGTQKTLLQPVVVRPISHEKYKYELRYGFRRFKAFSVARTRNARDNPWASMIPAMIDDHDEDDEEEGAAIAFALIENIQREEMSTIDEANAIKTMVVEFKYKQKEIADILGKSKGWVSQRMALTTLDPLIQAALSEGKIGHAHARELIKVDSKEAQREILAEALDSDWQVDDWKRAAAKARRAEKRGNEEEEEPEEESPTNKPPAPPPSSGYSVKRSPGEIKTRQEELEWENEEEEETPYNRGARDALLWVLGLADSFAAE